VRVHLPAGNGEDLPLLRRDRQVKGRSEERRADRKGWDGKPLNERDRRFYALRESGYQGPIDQDGYPDTTSEHADTLRYMANQRGETVDW
jgi:hypothetical protein